MSTPALPVWWTVRSDRFAFERWRREQAVKVAAGIMANSAVIETCPSHADVAANALAIVDAIATQEDWKP